MCLICLDLPQVSRLKRTKPRIWTCWRQRHMGDCPCVWGPVIRNSIIASICVKDWTLSSLSASQPLTLHLDSYALFWCVFCLRVCVSMTVIVMQCLAQSHSGCQYLCVLHVFKLINLFFLLQIRATSSHTQERSHTLWFIVNTVSALLSFLTRCANLSPPLHLSNLLPSLQRLHCCHGDLLLHHRWDLHLPSLVRWIRWPYQQIKEKAFRVPFSASRKRYRCVKHSWHFRAMRKRFWHKISGGLMILAALCERVRERIERGS